MVLALPAISLRNFYEDETIVIMKSMTGFGTHKAETKDTSVEVSIRAVNGRFLETRFHLPREFVPFENDLKKILGEKLKRGTVDIFVGRKVKNKASRTKVQVNEDLASQYLLALQKISKKTKLPLQAHVEFVARMPDVIHTEDIHEIFKGEDKLLKKVFEMAVKAADTERNREGKALQKDMEKVLSGLEAEIKVISGLRSEANAQLLERFETKIRARLKNEEVDKQRISQEIVIQLERADINEELTRLQEHIKNYRNMLSGASSEGKKLDFYTQELLREVNTIGSKSQVAKITQSVVEAKTLIERLREQVQNIE